ncbi:unnamed protein product [Lupinus luteus]|uniref:Uncharacterized protein n=1 Tax=Lupinus luteus TaxID=3873 RepID=A0AAV1WZQ9_LUPLU
MASPTNVFPLQFEWVWQHPAKSLFVRKASVGFTSLSGLANRIKLAYTMLSLPSWQSMSITVKLGLMDELPCYAERVDGVSENEEYSLDEAEFENNNSDSVPDVCDDSISHDSPNSQYQGYKVSASFGWKQEYEAREPPSHSFTSEDQKPYSYNNKTASMMSRQLAMNNSTKFCIFFLKSFHGSTFAKP